MQTVIVRGIPFKHSLSSEGLAQATERVGTSQTVTKHWAKKLRMAIASADEAGQADARDWLLHSPEVVLTASVAANRKLKPAKRQSLERCLTVPDLLDFSKPFTELVPVRPKLKKPTTWGNPAAYRMLHDHRLLHRTAQDLITRVLGPYFAPRPFQFTHLGTHAAIARTKALIKVGYIHATRLDIVDFYPNFSAEALINELPLPPEVVEYAVVGRHMKVVMDQDNKKGKHIPNLSPHTIENLLDQARQGVPLGAGSSPIVGMVCVSRLAWPSVPDAMLLNYADDFQLLALTTEALETSMGMLTDAVNALPGGNFKLAVKAKGSAAGSIDFLGHRPQIVNGELKTSPTPANLEFIYAKLNTLDARFGRLTCWPGKVDQEAALECAAEMYALTKGWMSAFSECDEIATRWAELPLAKISENLKMIGISEDQIVKAIEPWMSYEPGDYALGL